MFGVALEKWDVHIRAESRFGEADRDAVVEVITDTLEAVIGLHMDLHVHVARWCTTLTGSTLLVQPQTRPRIDAFGDFNGQFPLSPDASLAMALATGVIDPLPGA
jgi:tRNA (Thr-GGU) A37 N-methylase